MGYKDEFSTVELVINSKADTAGVDAFALSLIEAERQLRKLFTYLIYQSPAFSKKDVRPLRGTLAANKHVYFAGIAAGFDKVSPVTLKTLVGSDYERLWKRFPEFEDHRNKIFHGQITTSGLSRSKLLKNVEDIKLWCLKLGNGATQELGYDGFVRNSFRKSSLPNLSTRLRVQIESIDQYASFIRKHMQVR